METLKKHLDKGMNFIGKDGRYYDTPEALREANKQWNNTHLTYICPKCYRHIQAGVYDSHLEMCVGRFKI